MPPLVTQSSSARFFADLRALLQARSALLFMLEPFLTRMVSSANTDALENVPKSIISITTDEI